VRRRNQDYTQAVEVFSGKTTGRVTIPLQYINVKADEELSLRKIVTRSKERKQNKPVFSCEATFVGPILEVGRVCGNLRGFPRLIHRAKKQELNTDRRQVIS